MTELEIMGAVSMAGLAVLLVFGLVALVRCDPSQIRGILRVLLRRR